MAERRMFCMEFFGRDSFISLSTKAQALYVHLMLNADDDGFVSSVKATMRKLKIGERSLEELKSGGYIYQFSTGVVLILHWLLHNKIRADRYKPTTYVSEMSCVTKGKGSIYIVNESQTDLGNHVTTNGSDSATNGADFASKDSGGEANLGEVVLGSVSAGDVSCCSAPANGYGVFENVILTPDKYQKLVELLPLDYASRIDRLSTHMYSTGKKYKDHFATILNWAREDGAIKKQGQENGIANTSSNVFKKVLAKGEASDEHR